MLEWRKLWIIFQKLNMSEDPDFKYIIRIANSDVSGEERLAYALTSIRGIGLRISNAIINKLKLDSELLAGKLSDKDVESIEEAIENINDYVPKWLLNRQNDYDSGEDLHPVSIDSVSYTHLTLPTKA